MDIAALILQIALAVVFVLVAGVGLGFLISRAPRVTRVPEDYRVTRAPGVTGVSGGVLVTSAQRATSAQEDFLVTSAPRMTSTQEAGGAEPQFEIYRDAAGESRFRLKAANREIIAVGEGYKSKAGCKKGIESIKRNAPIATVVDLTSVTEVRESEARGMEPLFQIYRDAAGEFRFRLKAANREIIAVGEGYKSKAGCKKGIESIKRNAPTATVVDLSKQAA